MEPRKIIDKERSAHKAKIARGKQHGDLLATFVKKNKPINISSGLRFEIAGDTLNLNKE